MIHLVQLSYEIFVSFDSISQIDFFLIFRMALYCWSFGVLLLKEQQIQTRFNCADYFSEFALLNLLTEYLSNILAITYSTFYFLGDVKRKSSAEENDSDKKMEIDSKLSFLSVRRPTKRTLKNTRQSHKENAQNFDDSVRVCLETEEIIAIYACQIQINIRSDRSAILSHRPIKLFSLDTLWCYYRQFIRFHEFVALRMLCVWVCSVYIHSSLKQSIWPIGTGQ